jgi:shikimate kinase
MTRDPVPQLIPDRGLALVGYRGTGKSTVGRILSERLGRPFLDADLEVEARAGRSISRIFADWGEPVFRDWEERTLGELTEKFPTAVIATGGGAVLREANRRRIRKFGYVVWLTAGPAEVARRLAADQRGLMERPALTAAGTIAEIGELLSARTPLYRGLADTEIETGEKTPEEVATAIVTCWASGSRT